MRVLLAAALVFALPAQALGAGGADHAKEVISREVTKTLGAQWVSTALGQAKRESGFNHRAVGIRLGAKHKHQRAMGIFQVLPSTARGLGFDPRYLNNLEYGVKVGVAYMGECIKAGVKTPSQMNSCFLYGYHGWGRQNAKRRNTIK